MRCDYCGTLEKVAFERSSHMCAPPFDRRPHEFTGQHPADRREAANAEHKFANIPQAELAPAAAKSIATQVREVLRVAANVSNDRYGFALLNRLAAEAKDETLLKLRRLLR